MSVCHNAAKDAGISALYWGTFFELHQILSLKLLL